MRNSSEAGRRRGSPGIAWVVAATVLVAACLAGWSGWQWLEQTRAGLARLDAALGEQVAAAEAAQQAAAAREDAVARRLDRLEAEMAERARALAEIREGGQRNWLLNEAEVLARLAQERLLLTADLDAAERLLEVADRTLARLHDPDLLPARKALAADIEAIHGARQVDVEAVLLRLGALQALVTEVAVPPNDDVSRELHAAPVREPDANWWTSLLAGLPLEIRRRGEAAPLPLNAALASLVRLSLDSSLQSARLALQQGRPGLYRQSLEHALLVTRARLDVADPRVRQLAEALTELRGAPVGQALPEIGRGRAAIQALREERAP